MKKILIISLLLVGLGVACFFLFYPIAQFPAPSGSYGVGLKTYHWVNQSPQERNTQDQQHAYRELMVNIFLPNKKNDSAYPSTYDPDAAKSAMNYFAHCSKLPAWLFGSIKLIKTHAQTDALMANSPIPFPVIIFCHGGNGPIVQSYTWMLEELASHGYVVVGINHPKDKAHKAHNELEKAQQLELRTQDVSFAITKIEELVAQKDPIWSNVDPNRIGMLGHSFGGRTTIRATRKDTRIKCGINLDGGIQDDDAANPFSTPFMFMLAEKSFLWNKDHPHHPKGAEADLDVFSRLAHTKDSNIKIVTIKDVGHSVFSDAPLQLKMTLFGRLISRNAHFGLEAPAEMAAAILTNTVVPQIVNFFDAQLKGSCMNENKKQR
jgi:dienelactone hydrolase